VNILPNEILSAFQKALFNKQIMGGTARMITVPVVPGTDFDNGQEFMTERVLNFPSSWAENHNLSKNAFVFRITSNNMYPTLQPDDMVLVEPEDNKAQSDGLYAIRLGENIVARRLMRLAEDEIIMICDNQIYPSAKLPFDAVVGKIIWFGREL
jgi:phage repressor protein C with HTH and peptisase S24 domain